MSLRRLSCKWTASLVGNCGLSTTLWWVENNFSILLLLLTLLMGAPFLFCFEGGVGGASERQGSAYVGFPKHLDTSIDYGELWNLCVRRSHSVSAAGHRMVQCVHVDNKCLWNDICSHDLFVALTHIYGWISISIFVPKVTVLESFYFIKIKLRTDLWICYLGCL